MLASLPVPASRGNADFFYGVCAALLLRCFLLSKLPLLSYSPVRLRAQKLSRHYTWRATEEATRRLPGSFSLALNRPPDRLTTAADAAAATAGEPSGGSCTEEKHSSAVTEIRRLIKSE